MLLEDLAQKNMETEFVDNPCRGIVLGMNEDGLLMQLAWIMGRSDNSKNRVYIAEDDVLRTEPADPSKVKDPRLIIYTAMGSVFDADKVSAHIVSNGVQTDTIYERFARDIVENKGLGSPDSFNRSLRTHYCEPDPIIFTPRISGYQVTDEKGMVYIAILKAEPSAREKWIRTIEEHNLKREDFEDNDAFNAKVSELSGLDHNAFPTLREFFEMPIAPGFGYCFTTYDPNDSKNLPSFTGEPVLVPIKGEVENVMETYWNALEPEWKVALGGKAFSADNPSWYRMVKPINTKHKVEKGDE